MNHDTRPIPALLVTLLLTASAAPDTHAATDPPRATTAAPPAYAALLDKYVTPDGVRYAAWHSNPDDLAALDRVAAFYAESSPPADRDRALAWHLNAYNAWILHNILDKFPTDGPLDNEMFFFHGNRITIAGRKTSFDHLEQKRIRPTFQDPRIHFALNCASESCPPLDDTPFRGDSLDSTLDRLTRAFLNSHPHGVRLSPDGTVRVSKIFDWYKEDFGGTDGIIPYINQYRDDPLPTDAPLEFLNYSWKLNQAE